MLGALNPSINSNQCLRSNSRDNLRTIKARAYLVWEQMSLATLQEAFLNWKSMLKVLTKFPTLIGRNTKTIIRISEARLLLAWTTPLTLPRLPRVSRISNLWYQSSKIKAKIPKITFYQESKTIWALESQVTQREIYFLEKEKLRFKLTKPHL